ncbi:hypothetical protein EAO73_13515 [Streptomyces sp. col6]|uniref:hypothetical protein n=1 Tax=Streptomyces sp. col6 TaxID=2478958 RepID=UPI0011CD4246|nr:hypothetical protein [Streptomyces sp. col6]TXS04774.1 hypothetical protein EAO73_13515 [Streptomyces sp. col6]
MRILGIHGIGNHRPDETPQDAASNLSAIWSRHLGPAVAAGTVVEVVYYADLLRGPVQQGGAATTAQLTDEEALVVLEILAHHRPPAQPQPSRRVPQGRLTQLLRDQVAEVAESWACPARLVDRAMARWAKEVVAYLTPGPAREAVQERLHAALDRHQPDILIAHSLGSVVAYETLHREDAPPVALWLTLGSPLALRGVVFDRLVPAPVDGRGSRPSAAGCWANVADPGDLVAIPAKGISQRFRGVESDEECVINRLDFHSASRYLASGAVARLLGSVR